MSVFVIDYGAHSSVALPLPGGDEAPNAGLAASPGRADAAAAAPEPPTRYVEWAFGHWGWFARGENWLISGPAVLLLPGQATLGRREIAGPAANEARGAAAVARATGAELATEIRVERAAAAALAARLQGRFDQGAHGPHGALHNPAYQMQFVKIPATYWIFQHCNTVSVAWLRELGCGVEGSPLIANFELQKPTPSVEHAASVERAPNTGPGVTTAGEHGSSPAAP